MNDYEKAIDILESVDTGIQGAKAIEILKSAITELEAIKKRAEEVKRPILDMNSYGGKSVRNKIDFIIKGEPK